MNYYLKIFWLAVALQVFFFALWKFFGTSDMIVLIVFSLIAAVIGFATRFIPSIPPNGDIDVY